MSEYQMNSAAMETGEAPPSSNLVLGIIAGAVAALAGAIVWAIISYATGYEIGWIAVGVGFLVGVAVRVAGRGNTPVFGVLAAALALGGCVLGRLAAIWFYIAKEMSVPVGDVIRNVPAGEVLRLSFEPIDLIFIGIALVVGFKTAVSDPGAQ